MKVPARDCWSSRSATSFPPQISVWFDTVLPCAFPSSRGIYCNGSERGELLWCLFHGGTEPLLQTQLLANTNTHTQLAVIKDEIIGIATPSQPHARSNFLTSFRRHKTKSSRVDGWSKTNIVVKRRGEFLCLCNIIPPLFVQESQGLADLRLERFALLLGGRQIVFCFVLAGRDLSQEQTRYCSRYHYIHIVSPDAKVGVSSDVSPGASLYKDALLIFMLKPDALSTTEAKCTATWRTKQIRSYFLDCSEFVVWLAEKWIFRTFTACLPPIRNLASENSDFAFQNRTQSSVGASKWMWSTSHFHNQVTFYTSANGHTVSFCAYVFFFPWLPFLHIIRVTSLLLGTL